MSKLIIHRSARIFLVVITAFSLSACMTQKPGVNALESTSANSVLASMDIAMSQGKKHFLNGDYGMAEKYFRTAVETSDNNANAWIGLAASYDHLRRFKLADRAYGEAIKLKGKSPVILNNMGYSYLLRGKLAKARQYFLSASRKDPQNTHIKNNLALLRASEKKIAAAQGLTPYYSTVTDFARLRG